MQLLKQSTAATTVVGPVLDSTGAEYTGAVIGDLTITKNGTSAAMAAAATLTHIANGHYTLVFTTGNTDTLGRVDVHCNKSTYQMPPMHFDVLPATVYDALVTNAAGGANGLLLSLASNQVDVGKWLGTAVSTPTVAGVPNVNAKTWNDLATVALPLVPTTAGRTLDVSVGGEAGIDWANVGSPTTTLSLTGTTIATVTTTTTATNVTTVNGLAAAVITAASIANDAITDAKVASDVTIASVTGSVGSVVGHTPQTGDSYAIVSSGVHGNAAIKGYVDDIGVAGAGLTALGDTRIANLDAAVTTRMATYTQPTGFLAATFPTTVASTTNITGGTITTVTNLTNAPTSGDLTATMKTSVNAEVLDVLNVDTFAEVGQEAPAATQTLRKMLAYLYKAFRNKKTQTATTMSLFADDGATVDQKSTVSDDGTTFTSGEIGTGP